VFLQHFIKLFTAVHELSTVSLMLDNC